LVICSVGSLFGEDSSSNSSKNLLISRLNPNGWENPNHPAPQPPHRLIVLCSSNDEWWINVSKSMKSGVVSNCPGTGLSFSKMDGLISQTISIRV
jgi:hypothetical protein